MCEVNCWNQTRVSVGGIGGMDRSCSWIGWALCLCASLAAGAQEPPNPKEDEMLPDPTRTGVEPAAELLRCNKAAWRVPAQYLIVLHQGTHDSHVHRTISRMRGQAARRGYLLDVLHTFSGALHGFLVKMGRDALHLALKLPHVHYIEEDSSIFAQSAPWNLQKLMQPFRGTSENGTYRPPNDGGMAQVYLMDGGVHSSHREAEGRVLITDFNNVPEEDGFTVHRKASQCDSHGTHVAGVVNGLDSGVAPGAVVNSVRVLNCQGKGTVSGALAGLEYIRTNVRTRPPGAVVVLLPFIGGFSRALNAACRDLVTSGVVVIAAAGNYRDDACLYSPASEPEVIAVGAVNLSDRLMSQGAGGTNFGRCVDLFAPGDDIVSASSDCSTCFTSRSGTSQAAAHAAGVAAVILSSNQNTSPVQLLHLMLHYSISNTINFLSVPEPHHLTTPNLVAAMPPAGSTSAELLCRSVWSERSGVTDTHTAVSRCRQREEMMGCASYSPDGASKGETITVTSGQMECVAHSGAGGQGVYAVARCCVMAGLRCRVHARPDECDGRKHHLSGCTSLSTGEKKGCMVKEGVTSRAVCCRGPDLECKLMEDIWDDKKQVSCPPGWTLTDCRAVSRGSAAPGFVVSSRSCRVHSATGADGAAGIAVCCRIRPPGTPPQTFPP